MKSQRFSANVIICATMAAVFTTVLLLGASAAQAADVFNLGGTRDANGTWTGLASLEFVTVGDPGNDAELSGQAALSGGYGPNAYIGAVDYTFRVGKFEVTAGQYTEFLNNVANTDIYGLYNYSMWVDTYGCKIVRAGSPGNYSYSVPADWANRPVTYVSWGDAARFSNWLTNGQPMGTLTGDPNQDAALTEDGSYDLNGAMTNAELLAVTRSVSPRYVIPSEDEWHKAGYYDPNKTFGSNYWFYPTGSNSVPSNDMLDPDPGNNANFYQNGDTIGWPYYRTEVGEFENSDSYYGTFDQGGNIWEWNEAVLDEAYRGRRGGSFGNASNLLLAGSRYSHDPSSDFRYLGFRVSEVPEPTSMALLALGSVVVLRRRRA